jgi:hypothetical protein
MMRGWIELALGDDPVRDRAGVVALLEHVCFSCMISLVNGHRTAPEVGEELERAARLLLDGKRSSSSKRSAQRSGSAG